MVEVVEGLFWRVCGGWGLVVQFFYAELLSSLAEFHTKELILFVYPFEQVLYKLTSLAIGNLIPTANTQMQGLMRLQLIRPLLIPRPLAPQPQLNRIGFRLGIRPNLPQTRINNLLHIEPLRPYNLPRYLKLPVILDLYFVPAGEFGIRCGICAELWIPALEVQAFTDVHVFAGLTPRDEQL